MDTPPDLAPAGAALASVVAGTTDDDLDRRTPCADWTVRQLLAHVDGLTQAFRAVAEKDLGPMTDADPADRPLELREGWADRVPAQIEALVRAWRDPAAWTGATRAGGVDLPGEIAGVVAIDELVLHGWDLAVATGQDYRVDEATARVVLGFTTQAAEDETPLFGPRVPVPDDAPVLDRALGLAGRDPAWRRPQA